jgi:hypothetical protein
MVVPGMEAALVPHLSLTPNVLLPIRLCVSPARGGCIVQLTQHIHAEAHLCMWTARHLPAFHSVVAVLIICFYWLAAALRQDVTGQLSMGVSSAGCGAGNRFAVSVCSVSWLCPNRAPAPRLLCLLGPGVSKVSVRTPNPNPAPAPRLLCLLGPGVS